MALVPGTRLGHYEILASIGEGGMGEVYRAADSRLGRHVALKVLPVELARDPDRIERFKREARTVAALNHPHIVTIYSVEESGGVHFLTMELVEGEPLDRRLASGRLAWDALLEMAVALADALTAAHDGGIVHRDLKPANVMVTRDGRVKILDFGLAKVTEAASSSRSELETMARTSDGIVLGTMPYMSPEQVEGRPLDARTDIFSLGVMLHEMATGTRPFAGSSPALLISAILRDRPAPVTDSRPDVPAEFARLVARCLEKDRFQRVQTARDLRNHLDALRRAGPPTSSSARRQDAGPGRDRRSIVVLPFANLSPDAENEYFSDGLTEEIIADLSKVRALSVISRTSAMQLKGVKKDARTLGRELDVQYVLDGSVRKAGTSLRITAQLIDAAADAPVWSDKYSGTMDDVFEVQERVSREIVKALDITLSSDEHRRLAERPIGNPLAFELYLQARQELRRYAGDRAAALIREAIRIEGPTPPLMAFQAWARVWQVRTGVSPDRTPLDVAEREARELLVNEPDAPYGHSVLGHIEYERGRLPQAVHHLELALEKAPNDSDTILMLAITLIGAGQNEEGQAVAQRMMACDPLSPMSWMATGVPHWFVGRPERVIPDLQRGLEIDPHNFIVHWCIGYAFALMGRLTDAARHARALDDMGPDVPYTRQLLALVDGLEHRAEAARKRIGSLDTSSLDAHHLFHLAESFIVAGDRDRGLDLLERSASGFHPYLYVASFCRFLDPARGTPRFDAYLAAVRTRTESFAEDVRRVAS
jgi:serine/threonine protein kinase/tetratricopeptide (TPR) repeat protein